MSQLPARVWLLARSQVLTNFNVWTLKNQCLDNELIELAVPADSSHLACLKEAHERMVSAMEVFKSIRKLDE